MPDSYSATGSQAVRITVIINWLQGTTTRFRTLVGHAGLVDLPAAQAGAGPVAGLPRRRSLDQEGSGGPALLGGSARVAEKIPAGSSEAVRAARGSRTAPADRMAATGPP